MSSASNKSLLVIGECMMELSENGNVYQRAFAGDTYNSAVYAKRCHPGMNVQILTAVGSDPISHAMTAQWDRDGVGRDLVMTSNHAHPGIYAISTDEAGERSFTYWRKHSAATELMALLTPRIKEAVQQYNLVFFSGITLAILSDEHKDRLLEFLSTLKTTGTVIAFDPNYRAALWADKKQAIHWLSETYKLVDIALPGLADHNEIFGHQSEQEVVEFLERFQITEVVLKAEQNGVFAYLADQPPVHLMIEHESHPKDTTGAGDSFAGTYLAERLNGASVSFALESAAKVANLVVQHKGAIVDEKLYRQHLSSQHSERK